MPVGSFLSIASNAMASYANFQQQKENLNYQQYLNTLRMKREDNAYQRAVADMKKAGLSPLGAVASSAGELSTGETPQIDISGVNEAVANAIAKKQADTEQKEADGRISLMSSQQDKADAETAGIQMENIYKLQNLQAEYEKKLIEVEDLKQKKLIDEAEAERRSDLLDKRIKDIEANIESIENETKIKRESAEWNESLGHNPAESWSSSSDSLIGQAQVDTKALHDRYSESNAKKADEKNLSKRIHEDAVNDWNEELKLRQQRVDELYSLWKKERGISNRQNYDLARKSLSEFKKAKGEWIKNRERSLYNSFKGGQR